MTSVKGNPPATEEKLFACTNCRNRYQYSQLSHGQQLCKRCRKQFPRSQCRYCHLEYYQLPEFDKAEVCKSCYRDYKKHGEPSVCEYCKLRSAFSGAKCSRCSSSEARYGTPVSCDQCHMKCAFLKDDASRQKVGGKLLCLMCTMNYKKNHLKRDAGSHDNTPRNLSPVSKKPKLSPTKVGSNDSKLSQATPLMVASQSESFPTEQLIEMESLRDQVNNLKRQLAQKDQVIFEKEKLVCQLKAEGLEHNKECRKKLQEQERKFNESKEEMQATIRQLRRQLSQQQTKPSRTVSTTPSATSKNGIFD